MAKNKLEASLLSLKVCFLASVRGASATAALLLSPRWPVPAGCVPRQAVGRLVPSAPSLPFLLQAGVLPVFMKLKAVGYAVRLNIGKQLLCMEICCLPFITGKLYFIHLSPP